MSASSDVTISDINACIVLNDNSAEGQMEYMKRCCIGIDPDVNEYIRKRCDELRNIEHAGMVELENAQETKANTISP